MSDYSCVSGNLEIKGPIEAKEVISHLLLATLRGADALGRGHAKTVVELDDKSLFASTTGFPQVVEFKGDWSNTRTRSMQVKVTIIVAGSSNAQLKAAYLTALAELADKFHLEIGGQKIVEHNHHR